MYGEVLEELIAHSEADDSTPCVSIIVPLERTLPQRSQNPLTLKNSIKLAEEKLLSDYPSSKAHDIIDELNRLAKQVDFKKTDHSLGIYVGKKFSRLVDFPFKAKKKIVIDDSFETRDLIYASQFLASYWVLVLNTKSVHLFKAENQDFQEIIDQNLPVNYQEQYQYPDRQRPGISGDYQSEETQIKDERRKQFLRHVNKLLTPYIKAHPMPTVIFGVKDLQTIFTKIFKFEPLVVNRVHGDFGSWSVKQLAKEVRTQMQDYLYHNTEKILKELRESKGKRAYLYGIEAVWRVAQEGRGDTLVVEKDYEVPAFADPETGKLYFNLSDTSGLVEKTDAVDDVIELIRKKKGNIVFTDNGKLQEYQHIAVKTRY